MTINDPIYFVSVCKPLVIPDTPSKWRVQRHAAVQVPCSLSTMKRCCWPPARTLHKANVGDSFEQCWSRGKDMFWNIFVYMFFKIKLHTCLNQIAYRSQQCGRCKHTLCRFHRSHRYSFLAISLQFCPSLLLENSGPRGVQLIVEITPFLSLLYLFVALTAQMQLAFRISQCFDVRRKFGSKLNSFGSKLSTCTWRFFNVSRFPRAYVLIAAVCCTHCTAILRTHCKFHCAFGRNRMNKMFGRHMNQLLTLIRNESGLWERLISFSQSLVLVEVVGAPPLAPARHCQSYQYQASACIGHIAWEPLGCECCLFPTLLQQNPRALRTKKETFIVLPVGFFAGPQKIAGSFVWMSGFGAISFPRFLSFVQKPGCWLWGLIFDRLVLMTSPRSPSLFMGWSEGIIFDIVTPADIGLKPAWFFSDNV